MNHYKTLVALLLVLITFRIHPVTSSRATAVRYMAHIDSLLLSTPISPMTWDTIAYDATTALKYDSSISDLYYYLGLALYNTGSDKTTVMSYLSQSISLASWLGGNETPTRILYARLLSDTLRPKDAIEVLSPISVSSADIDYIRALSYYRLSVKDNTYLSQARHTIDISRRIYPSDARFPTLYCQYESLLGNLIPSDFFHTPPSGLAHPLLAIYLQGEDRIRLLSSLLAQGCNDPIFIVAAMEEGLLSEIDALIAFSATADTTISYSLLTALATSLKTPSGKELLAKYLASYSGTILFDTNTDLLPDLKCVYARGRPEYIQYDSDQDGIPEYQVTCDYGVPLYLEYLVAPSTSGNKVSSTVFYSTYPAVAKVLYGSNSGLEYNLIGDTLYWSPIDIISSAKITQVIGKDFYVPIFSVGVVALSDEVLICQASSYTIPSREKKHCYSFLSSMVVV